MEHRITDLGLGLRYARGPYEIDAIDQERVLDDLSDGTPPWETPSWAKRRTLSDYDHLVVARDLASGNTLGILGAQDRTCASGIFLWVEAAFIATPARGNNLLRRMLAFSLLRLAAIGTLPAAVVTLTRNPAAARVLRKLSRGLDATLFAPQPEGSVVDLGAVVLMRDVAGALGHRFRYGAEVEKAMLSVQRVGAHCLPTLANGLETDGLLDVAAGPMLSVLDLRYTPDARLLQDLRRVYRARGPRSPYGANAVPQRAAFAHYALPQATADDVAAP